MRPHRTPFRFPAIAAIAVAAVAVVAFALPAAARADSASNRDARPFYVAAMPIGFIPRSAVGALVGWNVGTSGALELFGERGELDDWRSFDESTRSRAGLRFLGFPANSFFIGFGLAYDAYDNRFSDDSALPSNAPSEARIAWKGHLAQLEAEFSIGNRWQLDSGLVIGATWFGLSEGHQVLARSSRNTSVEGNADTAERRRRDRGRDMDDQANTTSVHVAKFHIGWAF